MKIFLIMIVSLFVIALAPFALAQSTPHVTPQQLWQMNQIENQKLNATLQQLGRTGGTPRDYREAYRQYNYNTLENGRDYFKSNGMYVPPNPIQAKPYPTPQAPQAPQPYNLSPQQGGALSGLFGGK